MIFLTLIIKSEIADSIIIGTALTTLPIMTFVIVLPNEWYISVQWLLMLFRCGGNWVFYLIMSIWNLVCFLCVLRELIKRNGKVKKYNYAVILFTFYLSFLKIGIKTGINIYFIEGITVISILKGMLGREIKWNMSYVPSFSFI